MSKSEPPRSARLHLEQQRKRAKDLLRALRRGDRDAAARFARHLPRAAALAEREVRASAPKLSEAQLVVAREAGFASWARLKQSIQRAGGGRNADVEKVLEAALAGDVERVRDVLRAVPDLPSQSIHVAVALGDARAAEALLEEKPERACSPFGRAAWKPLVYVCFARYGRDNADVRLARVRIAERLIDLGAAPNEAALDPRAPEGRRWPLAGAAEGPANPELVDLLLRRGAQVNEIGVNALGAATRGGNLACLRRILGARPFWWTVRAGLEAAVDENDTGAARLLLEHGKRLGWEAWGGAAVERAIGLGRVAMIEVLLSGGAPADHRGTSGRSPLATAIRTGQNETAALLRSYGAGDADVTDVDLALGACLRGSPQNDAPRRVARSDHQLLSWAIRRGKAHAVPALIALGLDPNVPDSDGETPLHLAVAARSIEALSALLAAGARVDAKNFAEETPLALALRMPQPELSAALVEALRRAGAASAPDARVSSELFEEAADAVVDGDLERLRELLAAHPGLVTARSRRAHRSTLLHYVGANGVEAERQRSPSNAGRMAELLLERGAAPDALDANTSTTLDLAVTSGFTEKAGVIDDIVGALVRGGAKVDGVAGDGGPLTGAIHHGRVSAPRALVSAGARIGSVSTAAAVGRLDLVKEFVTSRSNRRADKDMEQALIHAALYGHLEIVEFLLERGVDPAVKDHQAFTALHWAAGGGFVDVVRLLVSRGAPLEAKNIYGGTVLDFTGWAAKNGTGDVDHLPVVELLLAAGADVEAAFPSGNARVDEVLSRYRAPR
jgi:ankyrin repeat protein